MRLEDQVVSLEIAKKLKELNVDKMFFHKFDGYPLWHYARKKEWTEENQIYGIISDTNSKGDRGLSCLLACDYHAYTVSELLTILPYNIYITKGSIWRIDFPPKQWISGEITIKDINLCNALGKMVIRLIENKLIEEDK